MEDVCCSTHPQRRSQVEQVALVGVCQPRRGPQHGLQRKAQRRQRLPLLFQHVATRLLPAFQGPVGDGAGMVYKSGSARRNLAGLAGVTGGSRRRWQFRLLSFRDAEAAQGQHQRTGLLLHRNRTARVASPEAHTGLDWERAIL